MISYDNPINTTRYGTNVYIDTGNSTGCTSYRDIWEGTYNILILNIINRHNTYYSIDLYLH